MSTFEYKSICAPRRALKIKGVKSADERYAQTLTDSINSQSESGWEYFRAETLPAEEKSGFLGKTTEKYLSLLIFRRENIETYEEPTFAATVQEETVDPMILQQAPTESEEEEFASVGTLGPATR